MDKWTQDFKYGLRRLVKTPGFTTVAVLSLALGIGANTAIFTLVDQVLLRMLPVENPRELVQFRLGHRAVPPTVILSIFTVGMPTPTGTLWPSLPHTPMPSSSLRSWPTMLT